MSFLGPCKEAGFSDNLSRVLETDKDELQELGYSPADIGVHSIRKGAGTYASSGTTAAPSTTVPGGLLVVQEMSTCFASEQEINMLVAF